MISCRAFLSLAALASASAAANSNKNVLVEAAADRNLQGVNLCAAYDIVVPEIEDGPENCECDGRTIVCNFERVCDSDTDNCAALSMIIDFWQDGEEQITYTAEYDSTYEPVQLDLDVSSVPEEGIESCAASYGDEGALCTCEVCGDNFGVDIDCGEGVTTRGCSIIDLVTFERFVPFFDTGSNNTVIARSNEEETSASTSATTTLLALIASAITATAYLF